MHDKRLLKTFIKSAMLRNMESNFTLKPKRTVFSKANKIKEKEHLIIVYNDPDLVKIHGPTGVDVSNNKLRFTVGSSCT